MGSMAQSPIIIKFYLITIFLFNHVSTHSMNSIQPNCNMYKIQKDLSRTCSVYKRSPLFSMGNDNTENLDDQTQNGYLPNNFNYNKVPLNAIQQNSGYVQSPFGYDYFMINGGYGNTLQTPYAYPQGNFWNYFPSPFSYFPPTTLPNSYWLYGYNGFGLGFEPTRESFDNPFKRWRRQTALQALASQCCSTKSCGPSDYIKLDKRYNLCDK